MRSASKDTGAKNNISFFVCSVARTRADTFTLVRRILSQQTSHTLLHLAPAHIPLAPSSHKGTHSSAHTFLANTPLALSSRSSLPLSSLTLPFCITLHSNPHESTPLHSAGTETVLTRCLELGTHLDVVWERVPSVQQHHRKAVLFFHSTWQGRKAAARNFLGTQLRVAPSMIRSKSATSLARSLKALIAVKTQFLQARCGLSLSSPSTNTLLGEQLPQT